MKIWSEIKKPKTFIFIIIILIIGSLAIFFNGYAKKAAVKAYDWFMGVIDPPYGAERIARDDMLLSEYIGEIKEVGNIRAMEVSVPERDLRESPEGSYEDYVIPQLNIQLQYAKDSGFTHILYKTSLYSDKDFDVLGYLRDQCYGMGLKLIMETDLLLLHESNDEGAYAAERYAPVFETNRGNFWQRLIFPEREAKRIAVSGIDPNWIYIADGGAKRLNPSYDGVRNFTIAELDKVLEIYTPDYLLIKAPAYNVKNLNEQEVAARFENLSREEIRRRSTQLEVLEVSKLLSEKYPEILFGVRADRVWLTSAQSENGIAISADYSDFEKGSADTVEWCKRAYLDYIVIDNEEPIAENDEFLTSIEWWRSIEKQTGVRLVCGYTAELIGNSTAWSDYYELANQYDLAVKNGCVGGIFRNYAALEANPDEAALLYMVFSDTIDFEIADEELKITSPSNGVTVDVPVIAVSGTCDNNFPIYINGKNIDPTERGFFATDVELNPGKNEINIEHKGKRLTLTVNYNIVIVKEVAPTGLLSVMGGSTVEYSVIARKGAKVTGSLNGKSVRFTEQKLATEDTSGESVFSLFVGEFTVPEAKEEEYSIGAAKITASYEGFTKTLKGASVTVQPLPKTYGNIAVVKIPKAESFRAEPANSDTSLPQYFWLPEGTRDYIVGESVYSGDDGTKKYYTLKCGLRVYQDDVTLEEGSVAVNKTKSISVVDAGRYTYVTFVNNEKVPFTLNMKGLYPAYDTDATKASSEDFTKLEIVMFNSSGKAAVTGGATSPLMSYVDATENAKNETVTYSFKLRKAGGFYGFASYYDENGNLVIRFRNPISAANGRLDGVRICIDAGHGGVDAGASGFNSVKEAEENLKVAMALKTQFESLGATVYMTRTTNQSYTNGVPITSENLRQPRIELISSFNADILISVHHNWHNVSSASGTEALYFYGFNQGLAQSVSDHMASVSGMVNRGGKYQNVFVYRAHEYMSILLECGFLSNVYDSQWLAGPGNTERLARAVSGGVIKYFS